jgi:8-oxo-dGTP diphosphatase
VSVIPIKNNEILLSKRGVKPRKGTYDFIGGFVNVGETIKQAAIRETFEETGLKIKLKDFIGEYSEIYVPNITYTLCFTYTAQILEGKVKANDDISSLEWVKLENIDKLDLKGSFPSIKTALNDIVDKYLS